MATRNNVAFVEEQKLSREELRKDLKTVSGSNRKERIYDPLKRAKLNPKSLRAAVDAKCWECQGCDADPAPRWRIGNCEIPNCPLYSIRPYQSKYGKQLPKFLRDIGLIGNLNLTPLPECQDLRLDSQEVRDGSCEHAESISEGGQ